MEMLLQYKIMVFIKNTGTVLFKLTSVGLAQVCPMIKVPDTIICIHVRILK